MPEESYVKRLEDAIKRLEEILERLERQELPRKEDFVKQIEELIDETEEVIDRLSRGGKSEAEEVKEILEAVSPFLKDLGSMVRQVIDSALGKVREFLDGKTLGENISALYERLKAAGLPEDVIKEIIKDYTKRVFEATPDLTKIIKDLFTEFGIGKGERGALIVKKGGEKEGKITLIKTDKEESEKNME